MKNLNPFKIMKYRDAFIFISIGVILVLISILFHTVHLIDTKNEVMLFFNEFISQLFSHIGIGCIAIGVITILLDMGHWTHYFESRLSKIVVEKKYLEKLDTDSLINLQTEVLKAYFKNDDIGGHGGFLEYYQRNIQTIIGMPFRTTVMMNLKIEFKDDDPNSSELKIYETLSYICMSNSGKVQENVCYLPERHEKYEIANFHVTLQHDKFKSKLGDKNGQVNFDLHTLKEKKACVLITDGFDLDIKDYCEDGLNVIVNAEYTSSIDRFIAWRMSHPSRNVIINLNFPKDLILAKEFFFNENDSYTEKLDEANGNYYLAVHDWLLPDEGITFQLHKPNPKTYLNTEVVTSEIASQN